MNIKNKEITVTFPELYPNPKLTGKKEGGRAQWITEEDFIVFINEKKITLPAGIIFDFASIPRVFWRLFPPVDPLYASPTLIHDVAYAAELWPRDVNDRLFLAAMKFTGVPTWKRNMMFAAVRVGGGFTYSQHSMKSIMYIRNLMKIGSIKRPLWDKLI